MVVQWRNVPLLETLTSSGIKGKAEFVVTDFGDLKQVAAMADEVQNRFPKLNVLLCNAGIKSPPQRRETKDGLEVTFQVNHLAHFLLVKRLLHVLQANATSRVVITSSATHAWHPIDFTDLQILKNYDVYTQYSRSKLMNLLSMFALHRRLEGSKVVVNALHPGVVETKLLRSNNSTIPAISVEKGAVSTTFLADSPEATFSGKYLNEFAEIVEPSADSRIKEHQERLWQISEDLLRERGFS